MWSHYPPGRSPTLGMLGRATAPPPTDLGPGLAGEWHAHPWNAGPRPHAQGPTQQGYLSDPPMPVHGHMGGPRGHGQMQRGGRGHGVSGSGSARAYKYKTVLCQNWERQQRCPFSDQCQFAHGKAELRKPFRYRTQACKNFLSGRCQYGEKCNFMHPGVFPPTAPSRYKTRLCENWSRAESCQYGDRCLFKHGEGDMGTPDLKTVLASELVTHADTLEEKQQALHELEERRKQCDEGITQLLAQISLQERDAETRNGQTPDGAGHSAAAAVDTGLEAGSHPHENAGAASAVPAQDDTLAQENAGAVS